MQTPLNRQEGLELRELQRHCNCASTSGGDLWPYSGCNLKVDSIGIPGGEVKEKEIIQEFPQGFGHNFNIFKIKTWLTRYLS